MTRSRTYAELEISRSAWDEIASRVRTAGRPDMIIQEDEEDMIVVESLILVKAPDSEQRMALNERAGSS